jgi:teichuronic acid biosynthesis glycosyltransferase TuaG
MNRVTILIPTYNRADFLNETLKNCLSQTYKEFDIIVYDDCSTDNTSKVVEKIKSRIPNLTYIKGKVNMGIGFARQVLLQNLNTEFGVWLDSDDLMRMDRLSLCIDFMDKNPDIDILYTYLQRFAGSNGNVSLLDIIKVDTSKYDKESYESLKNNTTCATAFFRSSLKQFEIVADLRYGSEDVLWLWNLLNNNIKVGQINETLYFYRKHSNRISVQKKLMVTAKANENRIIAQKIKEYGQQ